MIYPLCDYFYFYNLPTEILAKSQSNTVHLIQCIAHLEIDLFNLLSIFMHLYKKMENNEHVVKLSITMGIENEEKKHLCS